MAYEISPDDLSIATAQEVIYRHYLPDGQPEDPARIAVANRLSNIVASMFDTQPSNQQAEELDEESGRILMTAMRKMVINRGYSAPLPPVVEQNWLTFHAINYPRS